MEPVAFDWSNGNSEKITELRPWFTRERVEAAFTSPLLLEPTGRPPYEERFICFSQVEDKPVAIVFTLRDGKIRPISARPMSRKERFRVYATHNPGDAELRE